MKGQPVVVARFGERGKTQDRDRRLGREQRHFECSRGRGSSRARAARPAGAAQRSTGRSRAGRAAAFADGSGAPSRVERRRNRGTRIRRVRAILLGQAGPRRFQRRHGVAGLRRLRRARAPPHESPDIPCATAPEYRARLHRAPRLSRAPRSPLRRRCRGRRRRASEHVPMAQRGGRARGVDAQLPPCRRGELSEGRAGAIRRGGRRARRSRAPARCQPRGAPALERSLTVRFEQLRRRARGRAQTAS